MDVVKFIEKLCLCSGSSLEGSLIASSKLLKNTRKLPIFIAILNDYLIPLSSPTSKECSWISGKNFLTCYEKDNNFYIKFVDYSIVKVCYSTYTIKNQYNKYLTLVKLRNELENKIEEYL